MADFLLIGSPSVPSTANALRSASIIAARAFSSPCKARLLVVFFRAGIVLVRFCLNFFSLSFFSFEGRVPHDDLLRASGRTIIINHN